MKTNAINHFLNQQPEALSPRRNEMRFEDALAQAKSKQVLRFSAHANERIKAHGINMDSDKQHQLRVAVHKAQAKGIKEALIVCPSESFVVSVRNQSVITVVPRNAAEGGVFSNIDGAVLMEGVTERG